MPTAQNPLQIVDISEVTHASATELLQAATSQGFLFVKGHGMTAAEVSNLFKISKLFFELPVEYKNSIPIDLSNHGYTNYGGENLDPDTQKNGDPKEAFNIADVNFKTGVPNRELHSWFYEDPSRYEAVNSAMVKLFDLSIRILRLLAVALDIEDSETSEGAEWFTSRYDGEKASGTTFRFLHYPGQKSLNPEAVIRAGAHTDYGSMTLLFQQEGQEGLEILLPVSKSWEPVPYVGPDNETEAAPLVVNIADQLSYWTGGLLKSTVHRVKFPSSAQITGQDRYSIVFFSHPNDATLLEPVPSKVVQAITNRGANKAQKVITAKEHLDKRLAATYGW